MTLELWSTVASVGTFLVITATAVAAVAQLRHLRNSNQLNGLLNVLSRVEDPSFNEWVDEAGAVLAANLEDPAYRRNIVDGTFDRKNNPWLNLANSYEWVGSLIKHRLIPEETFMDVYSYRVLQAWNLVEDVVALRRQGAGSNAHWENFEYLVVRARAFSAKHPDGWYPRGTPRLRLSTKWLEADGQLSAVQDRTVFSLPTKPK